MYDLHTCINSSYFITERIEDESFLVNYADSHADMEVFKASKQRRPLVEYNRFNICSVDPAFTQCSVSISRLLRRFKPSKHEISTQCWVNISTLTQHWVGVSCLLGTDVLIDVYREIQQSVCCGNGEVELPESSASNLNYVVKGEKTLH